MADGKMPSKASPWPRGQILVKNGLAAETSLRREKLGIGGGGRRRAEPIASRKIACRNSENGQYATGLGETRSVLDAEESPKRPPAP